ncbi:glycan-binding surface protein [Bacteroides sp. 519]|uniref:glycan-binding surface protein n=1 Tax=Bacteroides sp. 519 TaxID=2302937 RepID=UPI0013CFB319|nr:glycan-binding surface protein [Bacteroides sp. 519]NDV60564.1 hypothetical protein [Bacteroides sp. 519]
MKKDIKTTIAGLVALCVFLTGALIGCEHVDDGKYKMTNGLPEVYYVRLTDTTKADSLIVEAFMEQNICLIGNNLTSIQEIYFNDQKATLNMNFITNETLILNVPKNIPEDVTNKIYLITGNKDIVEYDFRVLVPAPVVKSMKCEFVAAGQTATIYGDYLLDDPNIPLEVTFSGNVKGQVTASSKTEVQVVVPEGALEGPIVVKSLYGNGRSTFHFRDSRGWITGFEDSENDGAGFVPGWGRPGNIEEDPELSLMGKYVKMTGAISPGNDEDSWASGGNNFTINIWSKDNPDNPNIGIPNPMVTSNPATSILKVDVNVVEAWSASPMIFTFAAADDKEGWLWNDTTQPRGFWAPWTTTGSYVSNGWVTVSIPLSEMIYNGAGEEIAASKNFGQLGIAVHNRGGSPYIGTPCNPIILVDNIRIVPGE